MGWGCAGAVSREGLGTDGATRCRGPDVVSAWVGPRWLVHGWGLSEAGREPSNGLGRVVKAASVLLEAQAVSQLHLLCVGRETQPNPGPDTGWNVPRCLVRADAGC